MSHRWIILVLLGFSLCFAGRAGAQSGVTGVPGVYIPPEISDAPKPAEPEAETDLKQNGEPEFPYGQVIRDSGPPYDKVFYSPSFSGRLEPKAGGLRVEFPSDFLQGGFRYDTPLNGGFNTNKAEVRLGRFYLDFLTLSTSLLYSDNANRTDLNRKDGVIGIVQLDVLGIFQITDNLRLAFKAGLVYLPFENKFGLAGVTRDNFSGRLFYGSEYSHLTQLTYDARVAGWDLQVYDHLRADPVLGERYDLAAGDSLDEEDRVGRYVFRNNVNQSPGGNNVRVNETSQNYSKAFIEARNTAGVSINRLLPTDTRLEMGAYHSDMFYYGVDTSSLPRTRDGAYVSLRSERDTMRFQPFASYRIFRSDDRRWNQEARVGASGPASENIQLLGSVGYFWDDEDNKERFLANARIRHTLGPLTVQELEYRRDVTYPEEDLENSYTYRLRQTLGPYVFGEAFLKYTDFEDLNGNRSGSKEWRTGVHFTGKLSTRTSLQVGGFFSQVDYDDSTQGLVDQWTAFTQFRHRFTDSWETILTYQYQDHHSTVPTDSYYENLVILTLTYHFGQRGNNNNNNSAAYIEGVKSRPPGP